MSYLKRLLLKTVLLILNFTSFLLFILVYSTKKSSAFVTFISKKKDQLVKTLMWRRGVLFKPATHGGVVVLSIVAVMFGSVFGRSGVEAQNLQTDEGSVMSAQTSAVTVLPENRPRTEVLTYTVKSGDTISTIAQAYSVSQDTIVWANNIPDVTGIHPGEDLKIPPVSGVLHTVTSGETLDSVAKKFKADTQTIADFPSNAIDDSFSIKAGQVLVVPNGQVIVPVAPRSFALDTSNLGSISPSGSAHGSGLMRWPMVGGISQYSSFFHPGAIDITDPVGTTITAADGGQVILVQKLTYGYGWHVVIDHGNGYTSLYAHMSAMFVSVGQTVSKGQAVGAVGMSGRTTGPHLHFEIRKNGVPVNPTSLLP